MLEDLVDFLVEVECEDIMIADCTGCASVYFPLSPEATGRLLHRAKKSEWIFGGFYVMEEHLMQMRNHGGKTCRIRLENCLFDFEESDFTFCNLANCKFARDFEPSVVMAERPNQNEEKQEEGVKK